MDFTEFRYRSGALWIEALKALAGSFVCLGVAASLPLDWFPGGLMLVLGIIFLGYGGLTVYRTRMRIVATTEGLLELPSGRSLPWREILRLQLVYYSTRRDREDGWMELTLRANNAAWRVDSRLDGFQEFVRVVLRHTAENEIEMDSTTAHNLKALAP